MTTVIIVIHLMVVVALVGLVLLQRSEGGALGIGGGSGAFMTGRGAANVLTRSTGILAAVFFATSISLALLSRFNGSPSDIFDSLTGQSAPAAVETPAEPASVPATGGSAEEMLRQLNGSAGPQTPPADSSGAQTPSPESNSGQAPSSGQASSSESGNGSAANPPATDQGASLPVPDSAPAGGFDGTPSSGSDAAGTASRRRVA